MIHQYLLNIEIFSTEKPAFNLSFMERYWNISSVESDLAVSHLCKIEMSEHLNYFNVQSLGWKWKLFQCNFQPCWNIFVMQKYPSNIKPHLKINQKPAANDLHILSLPHSFGYALLLFGNLYSKFIRKKINKIEILDWMLCGLPKWRKENESKKNLLIFRIKELKTWNMFEMNKGIKKILIC